MPGYPLIAETTRKNTQTTIFFTVNYNRLQLAPIDGEWMKINSNKNPVKRIGYKHSHLHLKSPVKDEKLLMVILQNHVAPINQTQIYNMQKY